MFQLKSNSEELDSECEDVVGVPEPICFTYITFLWMHKNDIQLMPMSKA